MHTCMLKKIKFITKCMYIIFNTPCCMVLVMNQALYIVSYTMMFHTNANEDISILVIYGNNIESTNLCPVIIIPATPTHLIFYHTYCKLLQYIYDCCSQ